MKCFLLLAAVYSLIIHQWHKENGEQVPSTAVVKTIPKKTEQSKTIAETKADPQFVVLFSFLKINK